MEHTVSACGVICGTCPSYPDTCEGCRACEGTPHWITYLDAASCPLYACCVTQKQLKHCGECAELPCGLFYSLKDPEISQEAHLQSISDRLAVLVTL